MEFYTDDADGTNPVRMKPFAPSPVIPLELWVIPVELNAPRELADLSSKLCFVVVPPTNGQKRYVLVHRLGDPEFFMETTKVFIADEMVESPLLLEFVRKVAASVSRGADRLAARVQ